MCRPFGTEPGWGMRSYAAVIGRSPYTGLYVGHIPGFPGAHSQGESIEELTANLEEVVEMLIEDGRARARGRVRGDLDGEGRGV